MSYHPIGNIVDGLDMSKAFPDSTTKSNVSTFSRSALPTQSALAPATVVSSLPRVPLHTAYMGPMQFPGPAPLPPIPSCLDAGWQAALSYCETYPGNNGPDTAANAICAVARSQPAWYSQVKSTPPCAPPPPPVKDLTESGAQPSSEDKPSSEKAEEPNYLLWGGIALVVVAAGAGIFYYSTKKKG
jgi:hypothetical protein